MSERHATFVSDPLSADVGKYTRNSPTIAVPIGRELRVFDTDDAARMWRAVIAALRALGFRVKRVESADCILVTRAAATSCFDDLEVEVIPRGDAQLVVRVEPAAAISDAPEPVPSESFFEMVSQELYLTAHRV